MHTYDVDALFATVAKNFWVERQRANATGGKNNIRAKGDGPENAVREWLSSVVGARYRVTEGHVVRADGRKSKQFDIIIVWDSGAETLYGSRPGEPELVRAECVAAVGEVKSSWYDHNDLIRSFSQTVDEIEYLQEGLLVENRARFGTIRDNTPIGDLALPISGRAWKNKCYSFILALDLAKCDLKHLSDNLEKVGVKPLDGSALILDEELGGAISLPSRVKNDGKHVTGLQCEVYRSPEEAKIPNSWTTLQEIVSPPATAAGRLLHLFLSDLQLHLSTWSWEFTDLRRYVKLSPALRRRHPKENPQ